MTEPPVAPWRVPPPRSEEELLERAEQLAGLPLAALAARAGLTLPQDMRQAKGHAGTLLELALGADAASRPQPDFSALGIELKSVPVNALGAPTESTYLCVAPLRGAVGQRFEDSVAWRKLRRILWMPIESEPSLPLAERRIGWPLLWSPDAHQALTLREDWEELMELLSTGSFAELDSRVGKYLQIRPKAANARALAPSFDASGLPAATLPRGFYLRTRLTRRILGVDTAD
jgi:DNA mismatch repair protein MutH